MEPDTDTVKGLLKEKILDLLDEEFLRPAGLDYDLFVEPRGEPGEEELVYVGTNPPMYFRVVLERVR